MESPTPPLFSPSALRTLGVLVALALGLTLWYSWGRSPLATRPLAIRPAVVPVDLNHSDEQRLAAVPGIGPTLARRIVEQREINGRFATVDDLRQVPGIGLRTLERLRPYLTANEATGNDEPLVRAQGGEEVGAPKPPPSTPLDLNRANREELRTLPGIGPVLAERIEEEARRERFRTVDDLRRVRGIGAKTLEKLRPFVRVGEDSP
jgi:competence protein ComEA